MAERKLNFNAPLLSTRRMYKKAVSVRRNKSYNFTPDSITNDSSSVSVLVSEIGLDQLTEPLSVPFTWEQAPGRLKANDLTPQVCDTKQEVFTPCLPPGKAIDGNLQSSKCKQVEESEDEDNNDDDDDDDVFSDARDMLSLNDSFISGVVDTTKKPLYQDHQSRDYMLNRFLPAAKAMTVERPHYSSNQKPSSFMSEPTIHVINLVPEEKRRTPSRYDESIVPPYYYHQDNIDDEESDKDNEDDDVSEYAYLTKRGCGMLPQLCFKESLGMMNAVPGFKAKDKSSITSPSHDQVKSSKVSQLKSRFQSVKKMAFDSVSKHKPGGETQSPVHTSLVTVASRSSSPYRHSQCMSPYRDAGNSSPFHTACFTDTRKETENMRAKRLNSHIRSISTSQELLYSKSNGSTSSLSEKTVHVDSENQTMINDQHSSNVMVSPEEEDKAERTKPDTNLELEAFEDNVDELGKIDIGLHRSHLAPPSPKKPSESWLLHNLPSVTTQITSRRYPFIHHHQKQDLNENSRNGTKWETIVKTSYMHRDHIRKN